MSRSERELRRDIAARFADRGVRHYVRGKLWLDPLYGAALEALRESRLPLLDIGCGLGLLAHHLAAHGCARPYLGLDSDPRKIRDARAAARADMRFLEGDAGKLPEFSGDVALFDALHYMPAELQQRVLIEAARRVAPGGMLLIRNALRDRSWRYRATVLEEKFLHGSGWMQSAGRHIPSREEISRPLEAAGLAVELRPLWGRTPYNSHFILARRPSGPLSSTTPPPPESP